MGRRDPDVLDMLLDLAGMGFGFVFRPLNRWFERATGLDEFYFEEGVRAEREYIESHVNDHRNYDARGRPTGEFRQWLEDHDRDPEHFEVGADHDWSRWTSAPEALGGRDRGRVFYDQERYERHGGDAKPRWFAKSQGRRSRDDEDEFDVD